eukprot:6456616-Amphidinium_carterae.1
MYSAMSLIEHETNSHYLGSDGMEVDLSGASSSSTSALPSEMLTEHNPSKKDMGDGSHSRNLTIYTN